MFATGTTGEVGSTLPNEMLDTMCSPAPPASNPVAYTPQSVIGRGSPGAAGGLNTNVPAFPVSSFQTPESVTRLISTLLDSEMPAGRVISRLRLPDPFGFTWAVPLAAAATGAPH